MKTSPLVLLFLMLAAQALPAAEIPWRADSEAALVDAKTAGKPLLLDFSATWCGPCRMMETTTFADPAVQTLLSAYIPVHVDFDRNPVLVSKYHIEAIPTLVVLNRFGELVGQSTGYLDPKHLADWLANLGDDPFSSVSKYAAAEKRMLALATDLQSADPAARERGVGQLLEGYLSGKEEVAKSAEKLLQAVVGKRPAEVLPHLNDHRLAIRILLARQFAEKLGPDFVFDPWENAEARAASLAEAQRRYAAPSAAP